MHDITAQNDLDGDNPWQKIPAPGSGGHTVYRHAKWART